MSLTVELSTDQRFSNTQPYVVLDRKERSRELAQKRRSTYKTLMQDLADELPFSKDVVSQVDYNSRLRLALCFFRAKNLLKENLSDLKNESVFDDSLFQELLIESLDGFLLVIMGDGNIIYLSQSVHKHLGLFQSEHIGYPIYDLVHEEDQQSVKNVLLESESKVLSGSSDNIVPCSFFCRMKCSRFKVSNTATKSPGYKLVFVSGRFKLQGNRSYLMSVVRPVSPPSILEIRMEGNMFVTHYSLQMKCIFFDGRLRHLMGYEKSDMIGHVPFEYHHHADVDATVECSKGIMEKGEGLSGYYRFMNKFGQYVWIQSRATMMFDSRTGQPSYIVCMNFVISKEEGEKSLQLRIASGESSTMALESIRSHDPFPVPREDNASVNPLESMPTITEQTESRSGSPCSADSRSISPESVAVSTPSSSVSSHTTQPHNNDSPDLLSALNKMSKKRTTSSTLSDVGYYSGDSPSTSSPVPSETGSSTVSSHDPSSLVGSTLLPDIATSSKTTAQPSGLIGLLLDQVDHSPSNHSLSPGSGSASPQVWWQGEPDFTSHMLNHAPYPQSMPQSMPYPGSHAMYPMPHNLMKQSQPKPANHRPQPSTSTGYQPSTLQYTPPYNNVPFQVIYNTPETLATSQYSPYVAPPPRDSPGYNPQSSAHLPLWNVQQSQFVTQLNNI